MPIRTRITQVARERGWTASQVARSLGLYRSNVSAMDSGKRSVSLHALAKLAAFLGVSPSDLLENVPAEAGSLSKQPELLGRVRARDLDSPDGAEKTWVHRTLLAWQRHYGKKRS
ncbi:MAG: helix-turn-helix transcriptional regulator [Candidatus Omnitrophica bacterium]|nr:helix-turn-helix transcriptional regulator [Candidatus Omnitrophota bacterium]